MDIHHFLHNKYNDFLLSHTIRSFAVSLISLFIPVFLLKQGVAILPVVLFEIVLFAMSFITHVPSIIFLKKIGIKSTLVISYVLSVGFYFYLYQMSSIVEAIGLWPYLLLLGLLNSVFASLFWMSYHLLFVKSTEKSKDQGKKIGLMQAIPTIVSIASPLVGGFLITFAGFNVTFLVSAGLFLIALIPLFFSPDTRITENINYKKIYKGISKDMNLIFFFEGTTFTGTAFLWPVLLFLFNIAISTMGVLYFISKIFYAALSYISGKKADRGNTKKLLMTGSSALGFSLIARSFSKVLALILSASPLPFITVFQSLGGIAGPLLTIPIHSKFYKSMGENPIDVIVNRELYMTLGRLFILGLLVIFLFVVSVEQAFIIILIFSGMTSFALMKFRNLFL